MRPSSKLSIPLAAFVMLAVTFIAPGVAEAGGGPPVNGVMRLLPAEGRDVVVDAARGVVYVSVLDTHEVLTISTSTGQLTRRTTVPGDPWGMDLSLDGTTLYVALFGAGEVAVIDLATQAVGTIDVGTELGDDRTFDVLEAREGELLVSAGPGSSGLSYIVLVELDNGNAQRRVADGRIIRGYPEFLGRGKWVYVSERFSPNALYRLNPDGDYGIIAEDVHGSINGTRAMALTPAGPPLVALASGQVLDGKTIVEIDTVSGRSPAFDPSGKWLYTARMESGSFYASLTVDTFRRSDFSLVRTRTLACPMRVTDSNWSQLALRVLPGNAGFVAMSERSLCITGAQATETCGGEPVTIFGSDGNDVIWGTRDRDVISAGAGDDQVRSGDRGDFLCGGDGSDLLEGAAGSDYLDGGAGNDTLRGGDGHDELRGGPGDDALSGDKGDDDLIGGAGDDTIIGHRGWDTASFEDAANGVVVDLSDGTATGHGQDTLSRINDVVGSRYDDVLTGDGSSNYLIGGKGDDTLVGGGGRDLLIGGNGSDHMDGGRGSDWASFENAPKGVVVDLAGGTAAREGADTLVSIENVFGSAFRDVITGNRKANILVGLEGDDRIRGGGGNDALYGEEGDDELLGGPGDDAAMYRFAPGPVTVDLHAGTVSGFGTDTLASIELAEGSDFADTLRGGAGPNGLWGRDGDDHLYGRGGDDFLDGMAGFDTLDGGPGEDYCVNGESNLACEAVGDVADWSRGAGVMFAQRRLDLGAILDRLSDLLALVDL